MKVVEQRAVISTLGRRRTRHCATVVLSATLAFAAASSPSMAAQTHSFEGSCAVVGVARFGPMGLVPNEGGSSFEYEGSGRCMGTLDGEVLPQGGVPASVISRGPKPVHSCAVGLDPGARWALTFYDPDSTAHPPAEIATIVGTMDVLDVLRDQFIALYGQVSGLAVDHGVGQGHGETVEACARSELTSGVMTAQLDTVTPLVSDDLSRQWVNG